MIVMGIVVASVLAFVSTSLKPLQDKNKEIAEKSMILSSIGIESTADDAEGKFDEFITDSYVIDLNSEKLEDIAFLVNMKIQARKIKDINSLVKKIEKKADGENFAEKLTALKAERKLPVYESLDKNGVRTFIFPLRGKGLWGPIWGYIALKDDFNTIYGATFAHKSETPGLGAEIDKVWFQNEFKNKTVFSENGEFVSITVHKGATPEGDMHGVDGISGGTITSKALESMIKDCLVDYADFFNKNKNIQ